MKTLIKNGTIITDRNEFKGDILIEDDINNVIACNNAGLPTLLIDRPHNRHYCCKYRIYSLTYNEIITKYQEIWK